ncbi:MAG: creatininase family protein [Candidatus Helarchaeota archaeon]
MYKKYLNYMTSKPADLSDYIQKNPLAYIPFGALEWHGDHMVLGVDSIKASYLCKKCAEITGGVLFPCVNWGAFDTLNFPFTFKFPKKRLIKNTFIMMKQLYRMGFRIIILLTGHYPEFQIKKLRSIAKKFSKKYSDGFALGIPEQALATRLGYLGDHAASWETSIMMVINKEYVDLNRIRNNLTFSKRCKIHGIIGQDPKKYASIEKGQEVIHEIITRLTGAIQNVKNSQSSNPFNEIYNEYDDALNNLYNIRRPFSFKKIFENQGIENGNELWNYIKWKFLRGGKRKINDKA